MNKNLKKTAFLVLLGLSLPFSVQGRNLPSDSLGIYVRLSGLAYQKRDFQEFLRYTSRAASLEPDDYTHRYNLACAHALNDQAEKAVSILDFLLDQNCDLALLAKDDRDMDRIRQSGSFRNILRRIEERCRPLNRSRVAFSIPEKDLIPEGMAYDPVKETFFISSLQKCKIVAVDGEKRVSDFTLSGQDSLVPVLGMKVDAGQRILWAVSSYGYAREGLPLEQLGTSGVFKYDLHTGRLLARFMLPQAEKHFLNDLVIAKNGDVYVTDTMGHALYLIPAGTDAIRKFADLPWAPNGIDFSEDGTRLFVAGDGIGVLDLASRTFWKLKHPPAMILSGDGLYFYKNSLVAVRNEGVQKITRFFLNTACDAVTRSEDLEANHPLFNIPTTGAVVGDRFYYIANSQLGAYDESGRLLPLDALEETRVLWVDLRGEKE